MPYETVRLPSPHSLPRFIRICDSKLSELMLPPCSPSWQSGDAKIQFRILKAASVKPRAPSAAVSKSNPKPRHVWLFRLGILAYSIHKRSDRLVVKNQASEIMAAWGEDVAWGEAWELL